MTADVQFDDVVARLRGDGTRAPAPLDFIARQPARPQGEGDAFDGGATRHRSASASIHTMRKQVAIIAADIAAVLLISDFSQFSEKASASGVWPGQVWRRRIESRMQSDRGVRSA
jgi:hypothetical protein